MRRRILTAGLAALLSAGLVVTPASSQDAPFTIDPSTGLPGDEVAGQLDPTVIADVCLTDVEEMQAEWIPPFTADITARIAEIPAANTDEIVTAQVLSLIFSPLGIGGNDEQGAQFLANTFILTFASIADQEPVGDTSNFDPATGAGSIVVPDLEPGLWGVAASCVFPSAEDPEVFQEAIAAGMAFLVEEFGSPLNAGTIVVAMLADPAIAEGLLREMLPFLMIPQEGAQWTATFTIPRDLPAADPAVAAFCAAIPQLPTLGEELLTTLAALPEDDSTMTQEQWAAVADWEAIGAELEELVGEIETLLAAGDTSRPDDLADDWASATDPLRQLRDALQAVDYDLSTESGRLIAGQLRAQATATGDGDVEDPAVAALTSWFIANCIPAQPARAPAAQPAAAAPSYTG